MSINENVRHVVGEQPLIKCKVSPQKFNLDWH